MRVFRVVVAQFLWFLAVFSMLALPAQAENPYQDRIRAVALQLSQSLDEPQIMALQHLRAGFGMVRAVRMVRDGVGGAVAQCAVANPDMEESMTARFQSWQAVVNPALEAAEIRMNQTLDGGLFSKPDDIRAYLDLTDKAAAFADGELEKNIVTTSEACRRLLNSLDETQGSLIALLDTIQWPEKEAE